MTKDQLELVMAREGLTRQQRDSVLAAAEAYATTQAHHAIVAGRCACQPPESGMHWHVLGQWAGPACDPPSGKPCTTERGG